MVFEDQGWLPGAAGWWIAHRSGGGGPYPVIALYHVDITLRRIWRLRTSTPHNLFQAALPLASVGGTLPATLCALADYLEDIAGALEVVFVLFFLLFFVCFVLKALKGLRRTLEGLIRPLRALQGPQGPEKAFKSLIRP